MESNSYVHSTKAGTIGGTLLVVLLQIKSSELLKTALLAATGAFVSFSVSIILRLLIRQLRKRGYLK